MDGVQTPEPALPEQVLRPQPAPRGAGRHDDGQSRWDSFRGVATALPLRYASIAMESLLLSHSTSGMEELLALRVLRAFPEANRRIILPKLAFPCSTGNRWSRGMAMSSPSGHPDRLRAGETGSRNGYRGQAPTWGSGWAGRPNWSRPWMCLQGRPSVSPRKTASAQVQCKRQAAILTAFESNLVGGSAAGNFPGHDATGRVRIRGFGN